MSSKVEIFRQLIQFNMARGVKTGGRKKGIPNRITQDIREVLNDFLEREMANIDRYFEAIDPKDRLAFIIKLLPYMLPKYENTSYDDKFAKAEDNNYSRYMNRMVEQFKSLQ